MLILLKIIFAAVMRLGVTERFRRAVRGPSCCFCERWLFASHVGVLFFCVLQKYQFGFCGLSGSERARRLLAVVDRSVNRRRRRRPCWRSPSARPPTRQRRSPVSHMRTCGGDRGFLRRAAACSDSSRDEFDPGHQYPGPVAPIAIRSPRSRPGRRSRLERAQRSLCRESK